MLSFNFKYVFYSQKQPKQLDIGKTSFLSSIKSQSFFWGYFVVVRWLYGETKMSTKENH